MGKPKLDVAQARAFGAAASAGRAVHADLGFFYVMPGRACAVSCCDPCGEGSASHSDFAHAGSGVAMYFMLTKAFAWLFVLSAFALIPNYIINTGGALRGGVGLTVLSQTMLGQIVNTTGLLLTRRDGTLASAVPREQLPALYSVVDILSTLLFSSGVLYLIFFVDRLRKETELRSVGTEDYTVEVSGLQRMSLCGCGGPLGCACGLCASKAITPDLLAAHFERLAKAFTPDFQVVRALNGRPEVHLAGADLRAIRMFRQRAALVLALHSAQDKLATMEKSMGVKSGSVWTRKKPRYLRVLREFLDHAAAHRERVLSARADEERRLKRQLEEEDTGDAGTADDVSDVPDEEKESAPHSRGSDGGRSGASSRASSPPPPPTRASTVSQPPHRRRGEGRHRAEAARRVVNLGSVDARRASVVPAVVPGGRRQSAPPRDAARRPSGADVAVVSLDELLQGRKGVLSRAKTAEAQYVEHEKRIAAMASTIPSPFGDASPRAAAAGPPACGAERASRDESSDEERGSDRSRSSVASRTSSRSGSADSIYADLDESDASEGDGRGPSRDSKWGAAKSPAPAPRRASTKVLATPEPARAARKRASVESMEAPSFPSLPPEEDVPPLPPKRKYVRKAAGLGCAPCCISRSSKAEWRLERQRGMVDDILYDIETLTRDLTRFVSRQEVEEEFERQRDVALRKLKGHGGHDAAMKQSAKSGGMFSWMTGKKADAQAAGAPKPSLSAYLAGGAVPPLTGPAGKKDTRPPHKQVIEDPLVAYVTFESAETAKAIRQLYRMGSLELTCRGGNSLVMPPRAALPSAAAASSASASSAGRSGALVLKANSKVLKKVVVVADDRGAGRKKGRGRSASPASSVAGSDTPSSDEEADDSSGTTLVKVKLRFLGQDIKVTQAPPPDTVLWMNLHTSGLERFLRRAVALVMSTAIILGSFAVLYGAQLLTESSEALRGNGDVAVCTALSVGGGASMVEYKTQLWASMSPKVAYSLDLLGGIAEPNDSPRGLVSVNASGYLLGAAPVLQAGAGGCPVSLLQYWEAPLNASLYVPWEPVLNVTRRTCGGAYTNASDALSLLLSAEASSSPELAAVAVEPLLISLAPSVQNCYCSALFYADPKQLIPDPTAFLARASELLMTTPSASVGPPRNVTVLRDGVFVSIVTTDVDPFPALPLEACSSWLLLYSAYGGLLGFAGLVVVATNTGVLLFLEKTLEFDRYTSYETERISLLIRSLAMQFLNTALLTLVVSAYIPALPINTPGQRYQDFTSKWFVNKGPGIVLTMVLQGMIPPLQRVTEAVVWRCSRSCGATGGAKTQADLNRFYTGPDFPVSQRYAENLTLIYVCLFYSTGIPILILVAAASFLVGYITDLFLFLFYYRKPPKEDTRVGRIALGLVPFAMLLHLLIGGWMMSTSAVYAVSGGATIGSYGIIPGADQLLDLTAAWLKPRPAVNCSAYNPNSVQYTMEVALACNGTAWAGNSSAPYVPPAVTATASATASASPSASSSASVTAASTSSPTSSALSSVSASASATASATASSPSATATASTSATSPSASATASATSSVSPTSSASSSASSSNSASASATASATASSPSASATASASGSASSSARPSSSTSSSASATTTVSSSASATSSSSASASSTATVGTVRRLLGGRSTQHLSVDRRALSPPEPQLEAVQLPAFPPGFRNGTFPALPGIGDVSAYVGGYADLTSAAAADLLAYSADDILAIAGRFRLPYVLPYGLFALAWFLVIFMRQMHAFVVKPLWGKVLACCSAPTRMCRFCCMSCWNPHKGVLWFLWFYLCACGAESKPRHKDKQKPAPRCGLAGCGLMCASGDAAAGAAGVSVPPSQVDARKGDLMGFNRPMKWLSIVSARRIETGKLPSISEVVHALLHSPNGVAAGVTSSDGEGTREFDQQLASDERSVRRGGCCMCICKTLCCCFLCCFPALFGWRADAPAPPGEKKARGAGVVDKKAVAAQTTPTRSGKKEKGGQSPLAAGAGAGGKEAPRACCRLYLCGGYVDCGSRTQQPGDLSDDRRFAYMPTPKYSEALSLRILASAPTYNVLGNLRVLDALFPASEQASLFGTYTTIAQAAIFAPLDPLEDPKAPGFDDSLDADTDDPPPEKGEKKRGTGVGGDKGKGANKAGGASPGTPSSRGTQAGSKGGAQRKTK